MPWPARRSWIAFFSWTGKRAAAIISTFSKTRGARGGDFEQAHLVAGLKRAKGICRRDQLCFRTEMGLYLRAVGQQEASQANRLRPGEIKVGHGSRVGCAKRQVFVPHDLGPDGSAFLNLENTLVGNLRFPDNNHAKILEALEMGQTGVGDLRLSQVQLAKQRQSLRVRQTGVGHPASGKSRLSSRSSRPT